MSNDFVAAAYPVSVMRTRATSNVLATMRSACSRTPARRGQARHLLDGEAVRERDPLGAAIAAEGEQFERGAAVGLGPWRRGWGMG